MRCKFFLANSSAGAPSAFCTGLAGAAFAGRPRKCAVGGVAHRCLESQVHYVAGRARQVDRAKVSFSLTRTCAAAE